MVTHQMTHEIRGTGGFHNTGTDGTLSIAILSTLEVFPYWMLRFPKNNRWLIVYLHWTTIKRIIYSFTKRIKKIIFMLHHLVLTNCFSNSDGKRVLERNWNFLLRVLFVKATKHSKLPIPFHVWLLRYNSHRGSTGWRPVLMGVVDYNT